MCRMTSAILESIRTLGCRAVRLRPMDRWEGEFEVFMKSLGEKMSSEGQSVGRCLSLGSILCSEDVEKLLAWEANL